MPCTATDQLTIVSASSNAQFEDNSAARLIDGVAAYENAFSANMVRATNTGSTGGFDDRASDADPVSVELDLRGVQCVQDVQIQWNYPGERQYRFTLWTSADGESFTQQGGDMLSAGQGSAGSFETFDIGGVQARYVRISATGNTFNDWVVIEEVRVRGDQLVRPPNGYTITISGTGDNQQFPVYGEPGDNAVTLTAEQLSGLSSGQHSYEVRTPGGEFCIGTFTIAADITTQPVDESAPIEDNGFGTIQFVRGEYLLTIDDDTARDGSFRVEGVPEGWMVEVDELGTVTVTSPGPLTMSACESLAGSMRVIYSAEDG